jgi:aspartokinase/homoserine dehydrogenase 1
MISKIAGQKLDDDLYVNAADVIKTDSSFGQARVNMELTEILIRDFYTNNPGKMLFVTGFIASNEAGRITPLGRGGSDYTAAFLYRSDGSIFFWSQGDLSPNNDTCLHEENSDRYSEYI